MGGAKRKATHPKRVWDLPCTAGSDLVGLHKDARHRGNQSQRGAQPQHPLRNKGDTWR